MSECERHSAIKDRVRQFCSEYDNSPSELIAILHQAQGHFGFLPPEVLRAISENLKIPYSRVYGVVTFYSYFTMEPKGQFPISICMGTACYVRGAEKVLQEFSDQLQIKPGQTTPDGRFSLDTLRCVGTCGLAPAVLVGEKVHGSVTPEEVSEIIESYSTE
jgi:NADP-reducing hydrogenase subunit HndA